MCSPFDLEFVLLFLKPDGVIESDKFSYKVPKYIECKTLRVRSKASKIGVEAEFRACFLLEPWPVTDMPLERFIWTEWGKEVEGAGLKVESERARRAELVDDHSRFIRDVVLDQIVASLLTRSLLALSSLSPSPETFKVRTFRVDDQSPSSVMS